MARFQPNEPKSADNPDGYVVGSGGIANDRASLVQTSYNPGDVNPVTGTPVGTGLAKQIDWSKVSVGQIKAAGYNNLEEYRTAFESGNAVNPNDIQRVAQTVAGSGVYEYKPTGQRVVVNTGGDEQFKFDTLTPQQKSAVYLQNYSKTQRVLANQKPSLSEQLRNEAVAKTYNQVDTRSSLPQELIPKQQVLRGTQFEVPGNVSGEKVYGFAQQEINVGGFEGLLSPEGNQSMQDVGSKLQEFGQANRNPVIGSLEQIGGSVEKLGAGIIAVPIGLGVLGASQISSKGFGALISIPGELGVQAIEGINPVTLTKQTIEKPELTVGGLIGSTILFESPKVLGGAVIDVVVGKPLETIKFKLTEPGRGTNDAFLAQDIAKIEKFKNGKLIPASKQLSMSDLKNTTSFVRGTAKDNLPRRIYVKRNPSGQFTPKQYFAVKEPVIITTTPSQAAGLAEQLSLGGTTRELSQVSGNKIPMTKGILGKSRFTIKEVPGANAAREFIGGTEKTFFQGPESRIAGYRQAQGYYAGLGVKESYEGFKLGDGKPSINLSKDFVEPTSRELVLKPASKLELNQTMEKLVVEGKTGLLKKYSLDQLARARRVANDVGRNIPNTTQVGAASAVGIRGEFEVNTTLESTYSRLSGGKFKKFFNIGDTRVRAGGKTLDVFFNEKGVAIKSESIKVGVDNSLEKNVFEGVSESEVSSRIPRELSISRGGLVGFVSGFGFRVSAPRVSVGLSSSKASLSSIRKVSSSSPSFSSVSKSVSSKSSVGSLSSSTKSVSSSVSSLSSSVKGISSGVSLVSNKSSISGKSVSGRSIGLSGKSISSSTSLTSGGKSGTSFGGSSKSPPVSSKSPPISSIKRFSSTSSSGKSFRKQGYSLSRDISRLGKSRPVGYRSPSVSLRSKFDRMNLANPSVRYASPKTMYGSKSEFKDRFNFNDTKKLISGIKAFGVNSRNAFRIGNKFSKGSKGSSSFKNMKSSLKLMTREANNYKFKNSYSYSAPGYKYSTGLTDTDFINKKVVL